MECDRRMGRMESFNASIGEHKKKSFSKIYPYRLKNIGGLVYVVKQ